jgi:hypothetical protein
MPTVRSRRNTGAGFRRWALALGLLASVVFFSGQTRAAPLANKESACISLSGQLTLKGSPPGLWWALTDDEGRVWKITAPTPEQQIMLEAAQNQRLRMLGRRAGKYLSFEQIKPCHIVAAPAP